MKRRNICKRLCVSVTILAMLASGPLLPIRAQETGGQDTSTEPPLTEQQAELGTEGLVYTLNDDGLGYTLTDYTGADVHVVVPECYGALPITHISKDAFSVQSSGNGAIGLPEDILRPKGVMSPSTVTRSVSVGSITVQSITLLSPTVVLEDSKNTVPSDATLYGYAGSTAEAYAVKYERAFQALDGLAFELNDDQESYTLIGYPISDAVSVTVPSIYLGLPVTAIGDRVFSMARDLAEITLPEDLTDIGAHAFEGCIALNKIVLPDGVETIGDYAFRQCETLTEIIIPEGVTSIGKETFRWCFDLAKVSIPASVMSIGENAFDDCYELTEITISDNVTSVGEGAFSGCVALTQIEFMSADTEIFDSAETICETATIHGHAGSTAQAYAEKYGREFVAFPTYTPGDLDGVEGVNTDDAIYLLFYTIFPSQYPVEQPCDFNQSGTVDTDDAIYLLFYTIFPAQYPLT